MADQPLSGEDLVRLTAVVAAVDEYDKEDPRCANCNETMRLPPWDAEPTPTCNSCAHDIVMDDLPRLLQLVDRATALLSARDTVARMNRSPLGGQYDTYHAAHVRLSDAWEALRALLLFPPAPAPPSSSSEEGRHG